MFEKDEPHKIASFLLPTLRTGTDKGGILHVNILKETTCSPLGSDLLYNVCRIVGPTFKVGARERTPEESVRDLQD
jgi:hypothetical protein